jgi:outer membrane protein assembly factor BamA
VFSQQSIENCQKIEYNPNKIVPEAKKSIVATQLVDGKIQVIYAEEYPRASFPDMIDKIWKLKQRYGVNNIYVDAANPERDMVFFEERVRRTVRCRIYQRNYCSLQEIQYTCGRQNASRSRTLQYRRC